MAAALLMLGLLLPSLGGVSIFLAQDATVAEKTAAHITRKQYNTTAFSEIFGKCG